MKNEKMKEKIKEKMKEMGHFSEKSQN